MVPICVPPKEEASGSGLEERWKKNAAEKNISESVLNLHHI